MNLPIQNFVITQHARLSVVERNFTFNGDAISLKIAVLAAEGQDLTITQLQEASLRIAIQHLQKLADAFGANTK